MATARRSSKAKGGQSSSVLSRIGNLGCIRFPKPLRTRAGIKRGDRLLVNVLNDRTIRLEKLDFEAGTDLPPGLEETLEVEQCACESPGGGCRRGPAQVVNVGWSYVHLDAELASELGFEPDAPIELTAEPSVIQVTRCDESERTIAIDSVACPP